MQGPSGAGKSPWGWPPGAKGGGWGKPSAHDGWRKPPAHDGWGKPPAHDGWRKPPWTGNATQSPRGNYWPWNHVEFQERTARGTVVREESPTPGELLWSIGIPHEDRVIVCEGEPCPVFLTVADDRNGRIVAGLLNMAHNRRLLVRVSGPIVATRAGTPLMRVTRVVFEGQAAEAAREGLTADVLTQSLREAGYSQDEIDSWLMALNLA